ncbi:hypothetical protein CLV62_104160 [Dysgonomonas alginatilytica]|uniref:Uncharacterized protein n=1 Tax=Dysgonomonas alginatilytica TaxID=1605892 RepID=A0A2V3PSW8_9BACT|nr:hypothetical protein [Dysgonomonas alginatilytica]PXV66899.1 hypothetical protein CLV62_104160 [Dysgonomonas alginatilytica]
MNRTDFELSTRERLKKFLDERNVNYTDFLERTNLSNAFLRIESNSITSNNLSIILKSYPEINSEWLLTGQGRMVKPQFEFSMMKIMKRGKETKAEMSLEQIISIQEELAKHLYLTIFDQNEQLQKKDAIIIELERQNDKGY